LGDSRDSFYRFNELYDTSREEALREISRHTPNVHNRIASDLEAAIVAWLSDNPRGAASGLQTSSPNSA
jgi:hypothetical protein